jgi:hypothetical protein
MQRNHCRKYWKTYMVTVRMYLGSSGIRYMGLTTCKLSYLILILNKRRRHWRRNSMREGSEMFIIETRQLRCSKITKRASSRSWPTAQTKTLQLRTSKYLKSSLTMKSWLSSLIKLALQRNCYFQNIFPVTLASMILLTLTITNTSLRSRRVVTLSKSLIIQARLLWGMIHYSSIGLRNYYILSETLHIGVHTTYQRISL